MTWCIMGVPQPALLVIWIDEFVVALVADVECFVAFTIEEAYYAYF